MEDLETDDLQKSPKRRRISGNNSKMKTYNLVVVNDDEESSENSTSIDDEEYSSSDESSESSNSSSDNEDSSVSSVGTDELDEYNIDDTVVSNIEHEVSLDYYLMKMTKDNRKKKCSNLTNMIEACRLHLINTALKNHVKKIKTEKKYTRVFANQLKRKTYTSKNEITYFEKYCSEDDKYYMIKQLRQIQESTVMEKPYRIKILESDIPSLFKSQAIQKLDTLRQLDPSTGEYCKIKSWIDEFMKIPFGKYVSMPVHINEGIDKCAIFMENAVATLDQAVYGLAETKMQIMQLLGQLISNPDAIGTSIAIHGDKGVGKTSIVQDGISKILNRPYAFIPLGGATDSSYLEGHSYTYEGSMCGKIVQILMNCKVMNPVIYFDELDKLSDTPKGAEIANILVHLTDSTQNSHFHDKYFSNLHFDLSKCIFIFS